MDNITMVPEYFSVIPGHTCRSLLPLLLSSSNFLVLDDAYDITIPSTLFYLSYPEYMEPLN